MDFKKLISQAAVSGLADQSQAAQNNTFGPQLLTNSKQETIWEHLRAQLENCQHFIFAIAFITTDMLIPFKAIMADLAERKIGGQLITSDYLSFNQPQALAELLKIPNLTVKISPLTGFHVKGYYFEHQNPSYQTMIIGSANFTRAALLQNYEWSLELNLLKQGALTQKVAQELQQLWTDSQPLTQEWLTAYQRRYRLQQLQQLQQTKQPDQAELIQTKIKPNQMQKAALQQLTALRKTGAKRGLVISATGTGKTYLGALDVLQAAPKRMLFVVHREQILQKALHSFQAVLGGQPADYGILSGNQHQIKAKYLFATIQTLNKPEILQKFSPLVFDYILIDEAHRTGAFSYRRLLAYFKPRFCLGMTATPERSDDYSIFGLFDYNIAYEIRLKDALAAKMLCPFHYIGIKDYEFNGQLLTDKAPLRQLIAQERIKYVLAQLDYYRDQTQPNCGLVFCTRRPEAQALAQALSKQGHPAKAIDGTDSISQREKAVAQLETGQLEYLVTVDIFNEGVDIPPVNQIIMLRNTQSQIVFLQQLGRGLRLYPGKKYVTVLDFIGNYQNNYLIPLALTEDHSLNKDNARQTLELEPILGLSTITFTQVARQQIYASLQKVKLDAFIRLRQAFGQLQARLGRVPLLTDFARQQLLDVQVFAENKQVKNYYQFLLKMKVELPALPKLADQWLNFATQELLNGMRQHELLLLWQLSKKPVLSQTAYQKLLRKHHCYFDQAVLTSVEKILNLDFFQVKSGKQLQAAKYGNQALVTLTAGNYQLNSSLWQMLQKNTQFKLLWQDVLQAGLLRSHSYDSLQPFTLNQKYTRKDVCRLLNWPLDVSAPLYGYRVSGHDCPLFITYQKDVAKDARSNSYTNYFLNPAVIRWYTRSPRHLDSAEVQQLLERDQNGNFKVTMHLFVKPSDADGKNFFYLGPCFPIQAKEAQLQKKGEKAKVTVEMLLQLKFPVAYKYFRLLTGDEQ
jgi:superfamily II DNA or RNA helicase/HKD family nuclease